MNFSTMEKVLCFIALVTAIATGNNLNQASFGTPMNLVRIPGLYTFIPDELPTPRTHMQSDQDQFESLGQFSGTSFRELPGGKLSQPQMTAFLSHGSPQLSIIPNPGFSASGPLPASALQKTAFGSNNFSPSSSSLLPQQPNHKPSLGSHLPAITVKIQLPVSPGQAPQEETLFFGNIQCKPENCNNMGTRSPLIQNNQRITNGIANNKPIIFKNPEIIFSTGPTSPFATRITFPDSNNKIISPVKFPAGNVRFPQQERRMSITTPPMELQTSSSQSVPPSQLNAVPVVRFREQTLQGRSHSIFFTTRNGIHQEEVTSINRAREEGIVKTGEYSYTTPDGQKIRLSYVADKNGFRPQGDHLPTPPPATQNLINAFV